MNNIYKELKQMQLMKNHNRYRFIGKLGIPSLRISTSSMCNHKCAFCQINGDFASDFGENCVTKVEYYGDSIDRFYLAGIRHFSITGGEPLLNTSVTFGVAKWIFDRLRKERKKGHTDCYLRLNTNGVFIINHIKKINQFFDLVKISLHTLRERRYAEITGSCSPKKDFSNVMSGIRQLNELNVPVRIQMVVSKSNIDEIDNMINFCEKNNTIKELKLFDLSEYSMLCRGDTEGSQYWDEEYVSLKHVEERFSKFFRKDETVLSVGGFGNPMPIYQTDKGLRIRLRRGDSTAFYGPKCLMECPAYRSCSDGHCNLELGPNKVIKVCRSKEGKIFYVGEESRAVKYFKEVFPHQSSLMTRN